MATKVPMMPMSIDPAEIDNRAGRQTNRADKWCKNLIYTEQLIRYQASHNCPCSQNRQHIKR